MGVAMGLTESIELVYGRSVELLFPVSLATRSARLNVNSGILQMTLAGHVLTCIYDGGRQAPSWLWSPASCMSTMVGSSAGLVVDIAYPRDAISISSGSGNGCVHFLACVILACVIQAPRNQAE